VSPTPHKAVKKTGTYQKNERVECKKAEKLKVRLNKIFDVLLAPFFQRQGGGGEWGSVRNYIEVEALHTSEWDGGL
jgi:hypothetical protein